ncbi:MAG: carboxypeptidase-like regulatory domain-containing protein [Pyrinomonadaceae bacterium]
MLRNSLLFVVFVFAAAAVSFGQTGGIRGSVVDVKGKSIADVKVTARQDGKDVASVVAGRNGKFVLDNLKPGKYNFAFEKDGFALNVVYDIEVASGKPSSLKKKIVMKVDQGTLVLLEATIFNQNGISVWGAKVVVEAIYADGSSKVVARGVSSRDGDVLFRFPVGVTKYKITASVKKIEASREVEVSDPAIYRTAISLDLSNLD